MNTESSIPAQDIEKNRTLAALSYLWAFSLIVALARRDSPFVQLHARQGLVLFVISVLLWPFGIARYAEVLVLALMTLGFIQAAMGNSYHIPVIGELAEGRPSWFHIKKALHHAMHAAIKLIKPEHVTPYFTEAVKTPAKPSGGPVMPQTAEKTLLEQEEKKLSALFHRVEADEKKISQLQEEIDQLKINR